MDLGKPRHRIDIVCELVRIAEEDEDAGNVLHEAGLYRNSSYFYIQAMEKRVRSKSFELIDPTNRYWRTTNQHHDLDSSVGFLVDVLGMDTLVAKQVQDMINKYVIGEINFRVLHNSLRYPYFSEKYGTYTCVDYCEQDSIALRAKLHFLKNLLQDIDLHI